VMKIIFMQRNHHLRFLEWVVYFYTSENIIKLINNKNKIYMYSIKQNNIFIALVAASCDHYNYHQSNAIQNLKRLVTCSA